MASPHLTNVRDIKAETVQVMQTFKLPLVPLSLTPPTPFPAKGLLVYNTNEALHEPECSGVWVGNGVTWLPIGLCVPPTSLSSAGKRDITINLKM